MLVLTLPYLQGGQCFRLSSARVIISLCSVDQGNVQSYGENLAVDITSTSRKSSTTPYIGASSRDHQSIRTDGKGG